MSDKKKAKQEKKPKESGIKIVSQTLKYFFPIAFRFKKSYFFVSAINTVVQALQPFVEIIFLPLLIDELINARRPDCLILYTALMVGISAVLDMLTSFLGVTLEKYNDLFNNYFYEELGKRCMEIDFALTEDKDSLDQIHKARDGLSWYSGGIGGISSQFFSIIQNILKLFGVVVLLAVNAPLLLVATVVILGFSTIINKKLNDIEITHNKEASKIERVFSYYLFEIGDFRFGKDIRIYSATAMMLKKTAEQIKATVGNWKSLSDERMGLDELNCVVGAVRDLVSYFYLGCLVIMGNITIGVFTQMLTAASTFHFALQAIVFGYQEIVKRCSYAYEYVKFMFYPVCMEKGDKKPENREMHTIEFKNVSFCYPKTEVQVLKNVSVVLHPGEHLSVVGLNGAGKTTFIKLLCRLYDVDEGEILLDGTNIKEIDYDEYVKIIAVVFQDFRLLSFSLRDNIALDGKPEDSELIECCKLVGLGEKLEQLPDGLDTMIFKQFDKNGIEPSGGEQQKIAIARALYKNAPIVILDEPTAALDPVAEYEIYRQFDRLVGGKTAIYISHRLSSCKFCDKIAVFSEGTIKEYGTHEELVNIKNGIYSEMFTAQAQYYS